MNLSVSSLNPQARVAPKKAGFLPKISNQQQVLAKKRSHPKGEVKVRGMDVTTMATSSGTGVMCQSTKLHQQLNHNDGSNVAQQRTTFAADDGIDLSHMMARMTTDTAATTTTATDIGVDSSMGNIDVDPLASNIVHPNGVTPINMDGVHGNAKDSNVFMVDTIPTPRSAATMTRQAPRKPKSMKRATVWSLEVENLFRFQSAGFSNYDEYISVYPDQDIEIWDTGFIKSLKNKHKLFMYFRRTPECEAKHLNKVKIYIY